MGELHLMQNFEISYKSTFCGQWPKLRIYNNDQILKEVECSGNKFTFDLQTQAQNQIKFQWYNKTEKHTKAIDGAIVEDQTFQLTNIRVEGIQIESWVMTDGHYRPRYFKGYVAQHKSNRLNYPLEEKLKSQLIWHFPGEFVFNTFEGDFWDWYFDKKQNKEVIKFLDKDPERVNKCRGSLDPCEELVASIKKII